ncbi:MAG: NUDIX hydrolase [archaeon]
MEWIKETKGFPMNHGTWIILERETWTGRYGLKVHKDKVIRPDRKEGVYEWVQPKPGAAILPIDEQKQIYLARTFSYAGGVERLFAPGGAIEESDSSHMETAIRELAEELGIKARKVEYAGLFRPVPGVIDCPQHMFIARDIELGSTNQESTERIKLVRIPLEEAVRNVLDSRKDMFDGQTDWIIMKAYLSLNR